MTGSGTGSGCPAARSGTDAAVGVGADLPPAAESVVDLIGPAYKSDPYPLYRRLTESGPIHRVRFPSGVLAWLVTGYDAAVRTLTDPRLGKNHRLGNPAWRARAAIMPEPQHSRLQVHLLHQDPPVHTRMRAPVSAAFAPARTALLEPRIEELVGGLIDALPISAAADCPVDLTAALTAVLPWQVLAEAIGLDPLSAGEFRREWGAVVAPVGPTDPGRTHYERLLRELEAYIDRVTERTRSAAGAGLLADLVRAHDRSELTTEQLNSTVFQLLVAGQEPVTNQLGLILTAVLGDPALLERLRTCPALIDRAVEEMLRHDGAFELTTWRFLAEDDELLGRTVPAGDSVIVALGAAGRDRARFAEPDRIDLDRDSFRHLAFGHGIHFCPGAGLARAQLRIVLRLLLERLDDPQLACSTAMLGRVTGVLARGVTAVPVTYRRRH